MITVDQGQQIINLLERIAIAQEKIADGVNMFEEELSNYDLPAIAEEQNRVSD